MNIFRHSVLRPSFQGSSFLKLFIFSPFRRVEIAGWIMFLQHTTVQFIHAVHSSNNFLHTPTIFQQTGKIFFTDSDYLVAQSNFKSNRTLVCSFDRVKARRSNLHFFSPSRIHADAYKKFNIKVQTYCRNRVQFLGLNSFSDAKYIRARRAKSLKKRIFTSTNWKWNRNFIIRAFLAVRNLIHKGRRSRNQEQKIEILNTTSRHWRAENSRYTTSQSLWF